MGGTSQRSTKPTAPAITLPERTLTSVPAMPLNARSSAMSSASSTVGWPGNTAEYPRSRPGSRPRAAKPATDEESRPPLSRMPTGPASVSTRRRTATSSRSRRPAASSAASPVTAGPSPGCQ